MPADIFVDSNIFIEIIVRTGQKTENCKKLFKKNNVSLITTAVIISEIEWVLRSHYEISKENIIKYLEGIIDLPNLTIIDRDIVESAFDIFKTKAIDWTDCLNASYCQKESIGKIYSYDKHFNKLKFLTRLEP
ncbi:hypothetical protein CO009_01000 [Candidatus Shapirobacteria bacterium CG_4_8_14_3_um_filter_35_11]|uniref:PIN domain-containing protein n=4 Tax=Candidatus Shapironibacteriota TaxID=1752721 RepID=A0A1J5HN43_9BACT|nr:MAG: hypothetical protein AUK05_02825 [Candidatus Shapirobacteria bacterium CG2_30_35_20]PIV06584.1 MAG: hypothetical protein COS53_04105 [Candidatus Shapirobacteria bacterium CG03_land_8_20_14_0_80_35_14]PJA51357.1 MAG: hypothetical protein CO168_00280 [Candidatus Shapirobacteria bacterium CG_4_9_14_3_um_filter_36_12]PJC80852.1 MAG: hypothetical protein CO009_01000 [Candidatus Shapirobacteria bacterium CG_4_8_14_3_um_filter_35_11]